MALAGDGWVVLVPGVVRRDVEFYSLLLAAAVPIALIEHVVGEVEVGGVGVERPILLHIVGERLSADSHIAEFFWLLNYVPVTEIVSEGSEVVETDSFK